MVLDTTPLDTIGAHMARGVDLAQDRLRQMHIEATALRHSPLRCTSLGELGDSQDQDDLDHLAGVLSRFEGTVSGASVIAMAPEAVLAWVNSGPATEDTAGRYVEIGCEVMRAVVQALGEAMGGTSDIASASIVEQPLLGILHRTHAPSDTLVVSMDIEIEGASEPLCAQVHCLLDPKSFESYLAHHAA